jgi:hypothetical protein
MNWRADPGGRGVTEPQLIRVIKAHIAKGDKAKDKAEQHYIAAGLHLATLKADHAGSWAEWETLLKDKIQVSTGRASELMQIADGRKTVAEIRAKKNETSKIAHAKERAAASSLNSEESAEAVALWAKVVEAEREQDQWQQEHPNAAQQPAKPAESDDARGAAHEAAVKTVEAFWAAEEIDLIKLGPDGCKYVREPVDRAARAWAFLRADIQAVLQAKPDADPQWWTASGCPYCGRSEPELVPIRSAATDALRRKPKAATPPPQDDGLDIPASLRREPRAAT